jgi:hypothetical protein
MGGKACPEIQALHASISRPAPACGGLGFGLGALSAPSGEHPEAKPQATTLCVTSATPSMQQRK